MLVKDERDLFDFSNAFDPEHYLYFYESILTLERLRNELNFLIQYTHLDRPMKILDVACGYGRHANELSKLGHSVTGLDALSEFLEIAMADAIKAGVEVDYIQCDMRELNYTEKFDRVFVLFNAIGYFGEHENEQVFYNVYNALKPGGILCLDSYNRDLFLMHSKPFSVLEREGNFMIDQNRFDTLTGRGWTRRTIMKDREIKTFEYSIRFYNPTEIIRLFERIGFHSCDFYGDWDGSKLDSSSKKMIIVAKK